MGVVQSEASVLPCACINTIPKVQGTDIAHVAGARPGSTCRASDDVRTSLTHITQIVERSCTVTDIE